MKIYKPINFLFCIPFLIFSACSDDGDDGPRTAPSLGEFEKGIIVINQGTNIGFGSLSFIKKDLSMSFNDVYSSVNTSLLGKNVRSLAFGEQEAFIISGNTNALIAVNRNTMVNTGIIDTDLKNPRQVVAHDGRLYVSNWGDVSNNDDDYIAIFDIFSFQLIEKVAVDAGPEKMVMSNSNRLYVAHYGALETNNKVTVISTRTNSISDVLEVGDGPESLYLDEASVLWVLCEGRSPASGNETFGELYKIETENNHEYSGIFEMPQKHPRNLTIDGTALYYSIDNEVYKFNSQGTTLPTSPFLSGIIPSNLTAEGNRLYVCDQRDSINPGELVIVDSSGNVVNEFVVGVRPIGVYFNN